MAQLLSNTDLVQALIDSAMLVGSRTALHETVKGVLGCTLEVEHCDCRVGKATREAFLVMTNYKDIVLELL